MRPTLSINTEKHRKALSAASPSLAQHPVHGQGARHGMPRFLQSRVPHAKDQSGDTIVDQVPMPLTCEDATDVSAVPTEVRLAHSVVNQPGTPLDSASQDYFEGLMGHSLSHVRVHDDSKARLSARALKAAAYTVGSHIVLGSDLRTSSQNGTLAHEIYHAAATRTLTDQPLLTGVSDDQDAGELAARRFALRPGIVDQMSSTRSDLIYRAPLEGTPAGPVAATLPPAGPWLMRLFIGNWAHKIIQGDYLEMHPESDAEFPMPDGTGRRADIVNYVEKGIYEIKPSTGQGDPDYLGKGVAQCDLYMDILNDAMIAGGGWQPGSLYHQAPTVVFEGVGLNLWAWQPIAGLIWYEARRKNGVRVPFAVLKTVGNDEKKLKDIEQGMEKAFRDFVKEHPLGTGSLDAPHTQDLVRKILLTLAVTAGMSIVLPLLIQDIVVALTSPEPATKLEALGLSAAVVAALLALVNGNGPANGPRA